MSDFAISTPALLFPAVSLLLLAYTNRFLALAKLIRELHTEFKKTSEPLLLDQIRNLGLRLRMIRLMQGCGVLSLLICVLCMFFILEGDVELAIRGFKGSLILLAVSLSISVIEIQISSKALRLQLSELDDKAIKGKKI